MKMDSPWLFGSCHGRYRILGSKSGFAALTPQNADFTTLIPNEISPSSMFLRGGTHHDINLRFFQQPEV